MTEPKPSEQASHGPSGALQLPRMTTPTWEVELLISGATVFGLMQLPSRLEAWMVSLANRVEADIGSLLIPLWIYMLSGLIILIGTFIVHLGLRAYWVALVGLNSVYPGGVRWSSFKRAGPYQLETSRRGREDVPALIEAADNRASRVFAVGVALAMILVMPMLMVSLALAVMLVIRVVPGADGLSPMVGFWALFIGMFGPWFVAVVLDQKFGARWRPDGRPARILRGMLGFYARVGLGRASNLPMAIYTSNSEGHRGNILISVASGLIMVLASVQIVGFAIEFDLDDRQGLPAFASTGEDLVLPRHYASQRAREPSLAPLPFIPDPLVRGPYLRLFVPYRVARHNAMLDDHCPVAGEGERASRVALDCYARLHDVRINGEPVAGLRFDAAEDAPSGLRGMLAMIPMSDLPAGRHELTLLPAPRVDRKDDDPPPKPLRIPFWR